MNQSIQKKSKQRKDAIQSFKKKINAKRSIADKMADWLTASFGTLLFLGANAIFFTAWILLNISIIPGVGAFDPFPFGLLTMIVSLEAIFLAIIVLISQNRESNIAELREEIDLYINTYAESEITKLIYLQTLLLKKNGIDISEDQEVKNMLESLEPGKIGEELEKQL
jgi:uncharacterized membrane protein